MRLTPLDIRQQQFTVRMFRGLDPQEVDAFLDEVADDYETMLRENALLREQVIAFEERSRGLADREKALQDTLMTAQKMAEEVKENARREAQLIVREAELQGDKLVEEARAVEARLRNDISAFKRTRGRLVEDLQAVLERYHRLLSSELEAEADDDEPERD